MIRVVVWDSSGGKWSGDVAGKVFLETNDKASAELIIRCAF